MGELYVAAVGDLGGAEKLCVIKKLPELSEGVPRDQGKSRRLLDEARVMVRLNHVNLVQVFDAGMVDGELYLAMELVAGRDLRAAWNRCADMQARIPVDMALFLVREVARGLSFVHGYGGLHLVHRDIAPPNILLSWQGEVKITDFGLAASRLKSEKTGPGIVFGRIGYLSPEQARGEQADRRTDIYALGVILWELLTGRPLVDPLQEPAEALRWVRSGAPEPPTRYAPDLPESLSVVVMKALSHEREARYAAADDFRQAISRELLRLAPDADASCVVQFLQGLYGDEIDREQQEHERLLREELPRAQAQRGHPLPGVGQKPLPGLTGVRAAIAARYGMSSGPNAANPSAVTAPPQAPSAAAVNKRPPVDTDAAGAEATRRLGQIVDARYRLDRVIGLGGMGAVYEAEHVAIRKKVAIKVLHHDFSRQADLVARFRREAQAASRVGHPNIIDVTDFGYTHDGSAYLVMEHLSGSDLGDVLDRSGGRVSEPRAVHIALQLVRALYAAHTVGVIHRDLKPENIFLMQPPGTGVVQASGDPPDLVKVLDFGIAMRLEPSMPIRLTSPGLTVGTPEYMAPEQASGDPVDGRADIYAVGVILYEMLTGRLPFAGHSLTDILRRKQSEDPPPPRSVDPTLCVALDRAVMHCLARIPADRPQTMAEVERALLQAQTQLRVLSGPRQRPGATPGIYAGDDRRNIPTASDPTVQMDSPAALRRKDDQGAPLAAGAAASGGSDRPAGPAPERSPQQEAPVSQRPDPALPPSPAAAPAAPALVEETPQVPGLERLPEPPPTDPEPVGSDTLMMESGGILPEVAPPEPEQFERGPMLSREVTRLPGPIDSGGASRFATELPEPGRYRTVISAGLLGIGGVLLVAVGFVGARYWPASQGQARQASRALGGRPKPGGPGGPEQVRPKDAAQPGKPGRLDPALLDWAQRAADNKRFVAPAGDNLLELLERLERGVPSEETQRLREQAVSALAVMGEKALDDEDPDTALDTYRALCRFSPEARFRRSDLSNQLQLAARASKGKKGRDRALWYALGAVEVAPSSVPARLILAETYAQAGKRDQAAAEYQRALDLHPLAAEEKMAHQGLAKLSKKKKPK